MSTGGKDYQGRPAGAEHESERHQEDHGQFTGRVQEQGKGVRRVADEEQHKNHPTVRFFGRTELLADATDQVSKQRS